MYTWQLPYQQMQIVFFPINSIHEYLPSHKQGIVPEKKQKNHLPNLPTICKGYVSFQGV